MSYAVKEIYLTVQGEGAQTGRVAVFCRFTGCNLWSGLERDRANAACRFCDTDFRGTDGPGGGRFPDADALAGAVAAVWTGTSGPRWVVFTGGEPLLQLDEALITACHDRDFRVAVETNGTVAAPPGLDWICVSPKPRSTVVQRSGHELKLVYPQPEIPPETVEGWAFEHHLLQPMDGPDRVAHTEAAFRYALAHPRWRLSVQTHKWIGVP